MKKYLLLFLLAGIFTFSSCSSDDDGNTNTGTDPIIGTWVLTDINPALISIEECSEESTITFNEDNTGNATFYLETNDCEAQSSSGRWKHEDSLYTIELPAPIGRQPGTVMFDGSDRFMFTPQNMGVNLTFERQ